MANQQQTTTIIGAGLAGLATALDLAENGHSVRLLESAPHAGGRCRSFASVELGVRIDNGTHLMLAGNHRLHDFARRIGSLDRLRLLDLEYPILDPAHGIERHGLMSLMMRAGQIYRLLNAKDSVADALDLTTDSDSFWEILCEAVMNTPVTEATAQIFGNVFKDLVGQGFGALRPMLAMGLSETFIDPAITHLTRLGAEIGFNKRLTAINGRDLSFADESSLTLGDGENLVLAIPPWALAHIEGLSVPAEVSALIDLPTNSIINIHYRADLIDWPRGFGPIMGVKGPPHLWGFRQDFGVSVTLSCAEQFLTIDKDELAHTLWEKISLSFGSSASYRAYHVVKEKRATLIQTPKVAQLKGELPSTQLPFLITGDWTHPTLPMTMEAAIRSGQRTASSILAGIKRPN